MWVRVRRYARTHQCLCVVSTMVTVAPNACTAARILLGCVVQGGFAYTRESLCEGRGRQRMVVGQYLRILLTSTGSMAAACFVASSTRM